MSPAEPDHEIVVDLDRLLKERDMTATELAERIGITIPNLLILKNNRARAIRFSTLTALCRALDCTPGDLLGIRPARPGRNRKTRDQPSASQN